MTKQLIITNSSKQAFTCPYRYYLSYVLKKKLKDEPQYLDVGSTYHNLNEWFYRFGYEGAIEKFGEIHSTKEVVRMKALATFEKYLSKYGNCFQGAIPEQQYKIWLFNIGEWEVYAAGKIDLIDESESQLIEFKTTGHDILISNADSEYNFWNGIDRKFQHVGYYLAAKQLGYNIDTVKYIVAQRSEIKPKKGSKKHPEPETVDEYIERYKSSIDIRDMDLVVTDDRIKMYMEHQRKIALEIIWNIENDIWNRRPSLCDGTKYGRCTFFAHCNFGLDIDDENMYITKRTEHDELEIEKQDNIPF